MQHKGQQRRLYGIAQEQKTSPPADVQITEYVASCSIAGRSGKKPYTVSVAGGCWKDDEEERDRRGAVRHYDRGKRGATFVQQLLYKGGSTRTGRDVAWRDKW